MHETLHVRTNKGQAAVALVNRSPDECPWCHKGIVPVYLFGYLNVDTGALTLSFFCSRLICGSYFLGYYTAQGNGHYSFDGTGLGRLKKKQFEDSIISISPDFVKIYNQAEIAEEHSLDQICGPGYRKALEFLIKDYIISSDKNLREKVENKQLGDCIKDHITYEPIKAMAKRAAWLGNDETHYVRKWIGKDITDLKKLIDLTVHWISTEALTKEMIAEMPDAKPTKAV